MTSIVTKAKAGNQDFNLYDGVNETFERIDSTGGTQTINKVFTYVDVLNVYGNGVTRTRGVIEQAKRSVGSSKKLHFLFSGTWTIDDNLTIPSNIVVEFEHGASFQITSGKTVTINGPLIVNGDTSIFTGDGSYSLSVAAQNSLPEKSYDSLATLLIAGEIRSRAPIKSFSTGWTSSTAGPEGGAYWHKTGATASSPTQGSPVTGYEAFGKIGGGDGTGIYTGDLNQAGYAWDINGIEWEISSSKIWDATTFGAKGDGSTNDYYPLQGMITYVGARGGGIILLPMTASGGDYRLAVTKGTNDKWGIKIDSSNITLTAEPGVKLRRQSTDISTYAKSFPLIFLGTPDSNLAGDQVQNVVIENIEFVGENTNHGVNGDYLNDFRVAIHLRNTKKTKIQNCKFTSIDSSAIWFQYPASYDYENSVYYNTTKNYECEIAGCTFITESHAVVGRALVHAIAGRGIDDAIVRNNYFEWCDDCFSLDTTFMTFDQTEDDTYTDSDLGSDVKRTGRGHVFSNNTIRNSSEHAVYYTSMDGVISNNVFIVDDASICLSDIKVRGRYVSVTGNTMSNVGKGIDVTEASQNVTVTGNTITCGGDPQAGIINVSTDGLSAFIDNRSDWFTSYLPVKNITISGNTLIHLNSSPTYGFGVRFYTSSSDVNYPRGQLHNITFTGNIINNCKRALFFICPMMRRCTISGNVISGPDFTETSFTTGTTMGGESAIAHQYNQLSNLDAVLFTGNYVYGYEYILNEYGGTATAGTLFPPNLTANNQFDYIKYWDSAGFRQPSFNNNFLNNSGRYFLDRTGWYSNTAIGNNLSDGTSNSEKKTAIQLVSSSDVRIYHDDANGYKAL